MSEMYILLTGGHTGIGLGVTKRLLESGNKLGLIIRSESRKDEILSEFSGFEQTLVDNIDFFYADLSDQAQVNTVAAEIIGKWPRIDRLFNNAGIIVGSRKQSKQGNELHLEINALAPLLLTKGLKPLFDQSDDPKVINTGTAGMHSRKLNVKQILDSNSNGTMRLYMHSKQAFYFLMDDLAAQWPHVKFVMVDPGPNKTKMTSESTPKLISFIANIFFSDPKVGSTRIFEAGFDQKFADQNRIYITNDKVRPMRYSASRADLDRLLAGVKAG